MKKWIIRLSIGFLVLIVGLIITIDILQDYPEMFKIKDVDVSLFKVSSDNNSKCYVLTDLMNKNDTKTDNVFLMGFRFKLDYISVKREHLWNVSHSADGARGHLDSIKFFNIFNVSTNGVYSDSLLDASQYKYFYKDNIDLRIGHHSNQEGCYEAQIFKGIDDFVTYYNANSNKYNMVSWMTDYYLFRISNSLADSIINNKIKVSLGFVDGKVIERSVEYKAN